MREAPHTRRQVCEGSAAGGPKQTAVRRSVRDGLSQREKKRKLKEEEKAVGAYAGDGEHAGWRQIESSCNVRRAAGVLQSAHDAGRAAQGSFMDSPPWSGCLAALALQTHTDAHTHTFAVGSQGRCCATCMSRGRRVVGASLLLVCGRKRKAGGVVEDAQPTRFVGTSPADGEGRTIGTPTYIHTSTHTYIVHT